MRKEPLITGETYHVYNRRTEGLPLVLDRYDVARFTRGLQEFNTTEPIGSIFENRYRKPSPGRAESRPLVSILSYNILPNHYHLALRQLEDGGISTFLKSVGGGYAKYFNEKYMRKGSLFQNRFQAKHIVTDAQLFHVTSYIHLNHFIHARGTFPDWLGASSWDELREQKSFLLGSEIEELIGNCADRDSYLTIVKETACAIAEKRYNISMFETLMIEEDGTRPDAGLGNPVSKVF